MNGVRNIEPNSPSGRHGAAITVSCTRSAPNHDWQPDRNEDLDNFMNGECPGAPAKAAVNRQRGFIGIGEPYSRDFGNWHLAFLSSGGST
jgi:hypothetical protein